jgi:hypothetical protein
MHRNNPEVRKELRSKSKVLKPKPLVQAGGIGASRGATAHASELEAITHLQSELIRRAIDELDDPQAHLAYVRERLKR